MRNLIYARTRNRGCEVSCVALLRDILGPAWAAGPRRQEELVGGHPQHVVVAFEYLGQLCQAKQFFQALVQID